MIEENNQGWIKLHRKLLNNPIMSNPKYLAVWVTLLLLANHKEHSFIWNNKKQICKRGEILTGRKELSKKTGVKSSTLENILKYFENEHQIGQQKTTKFRLITVNNYDTYQEDGHQNGQQTDNRLTTNRQQTDTNKNENNVKNEKNNILQTEFAEYVAFYESESGRKVKALDIRKKKFESRRKSFSLEEIKEATKMVLSDTFLQGDNDRGKAFGDIDFILRNDQQIEKNLKINQTACITQKTANVSPPSALSIEL